MNNTQTNIQNHHQLLLRHVEQLVITLHMLGIYLHKSSVEKVQCLISA
jgi:hypothetical protein